LVRLAAADDVAGAADLATWVGPLARRLAAQGGDPDLRSATRAAIATALRPFIGSDGIRLTASVWVVSADA
jgi:hypothetical protein